jgi:DNA-binding XRE family transcriptional regulator
VGFGLPPSLRNCSMLTREEMAEVVAANREVVMRCELAVEAYDAVPCGACDWCCEVDYSADDIYAGQEDSDG